MADDDEDIDSTESIDSHEEAFGVSQEDEEIPITDTAVEEIPTDTRYNEEYDFSIYEDKELEKVQLIESLHKLTRPRVSGIVSRYNIGQADLDRIAQINNLASEMTIKVASYPNDITLLWRYYGVLHEFWENIRNIYGSVINSEINDLKKECRKLIKAHAKERVIPERVHNNLLFLCSTIIRLKHLGKFSYETDRLFRSTYAKAKSMIVE